MDTNNVLEMGSKQLSLLTRERSVCLEGALYCYTTTKTLTSPAESCLKKGFIRPWLAKEGGGGEEENQSWGVESKPLAAWLGRKDSMSIIFYTSSREEKDGRIYVSWRPRRRASCGADSASRQGRNVYSCGLAVGSRLENSCETS